MMTLGMLIGLIGLLGGALFWAVRVGEKMGKLDQFEEGREKLGNISEFNRKLDEETDKKIKSGDDPVSAPWLRKL